MHASVLSLVVATLAPVTVVTPGAPGEEAAADQGWQGLDQEIAQLASSLDGGALVQLSGWTELEVRHSGDAMFAPAPNTDLSGFDVRSARIQANATLGQYDVELSYELESGDAELLDAFASVPLFGQSSLTVGQFRPPTVWSALIYEKNTILAGRTQLGDILDERDTGFMFVSGAGPIDIYFALQNGSDGTSDDYRYTLRGTYDFFGDAFGPSEGAWGYGPGTHLSAGVAYQDDAGILNGGLLTGEAALVHGPLSLHFEVAEYDEMYDASVVHPVTGTALANTSPFSLTFGFLAGATPWELVVRFEGIDDPLDTTRTTYGVNYYTERGHDAKWQLGVQSFESDAVNSDATLIQFGVTVGV